MAEVMQRSGRLPSWADIPQDLAGMVLRFLPAYADRVRFAAVCLQWHVAARQLPVPWPMPLLALPDGTFFSLPYGKAFRFPRCGCAGYKSAACGRWLVFPRKDGCFLVDPFTRSSVTLPSLSCIRLRPPNAIARYTEIGGSRILHPFTTWMRIKNLKPSLHKLILCSSNLVAALVGSGPLVQILVCQPGASSWSVRANNRCKSFEDMAFYQGKLYAIAGDENLLVINIGQDPSTGDPEASQIRQVINTGPDPKVEAWVPDDPSSTFVKKLYLVESRGTLLMVRRKVYCTSTGSILFTAGQGKFEVFRADIEHSRWVRVTTLGDDQMIFLGRYWSKVVYGSQYVISGSQIFFLDDDTVNFTDYMYDKERTSVGVYNMETGEVSYPLPMVWEHNMVHTAWLFPHVLR